MTHPLPHFDKEIMKWKFIEILQFINIFFIYLLENYVFTFYSRLFNCSHLDLQRLYIIYQSNHLSCLMSEDSALYGFGKELMPDLQLSIGFSSRSSRDSKQGLPCYITFHFARFRNFIRFILYGSTLIC